MRSTKENDSGKYVNGIYTTKNGYNNSGLGCPKGTRLYNTEVMCPIFFRPEDAPLEEHFKIITQEVAKDILPYYAISNYGRVLNIKSEKIMKPNYRPNGYEYLCLAAENCKNGQKKYNTNRLVMKSFKPVENMDDLHVNHINGIKSENYVDKLMPDGTIQSNLEWSTPAENMQHREDTGLGGYCKLTRDDANNIRKLHNEGWSYNQIVKNFYPYISGSTVQNVCKNLVYKDESYRPKDYKTRMNLNPAKLHRLSSEDSKNIRRLNNLGMTAKEIHDRFYSDFSYSTILDVVNGIGHK